MSSSRWSKAKLPLILISILVFSFFFGKYIPLPVKSVLYALSLSIKNVLLTVIPLIIFSFIFSSLLALRTGVFLFVILLIACVFSSNLLAILTAYETGSFFLKFLKVAVQAPAEGFQHLVPAWHLDTPRFVRNETALMCGFFVGIFFSLVRSVTAEKIATHLNKAANLFLKKCFLPLLPLFILGFVLKLEHDQMLVQLVHVYAPIFLVVVGLQITYMLCWYFLAGGFSISKTLFYLRNVLPATLTGFSTSSSLATMPVLLASTEKNINDPLFVRTIIPATVNIHTLGSAIGLTILALATLATTGLPIPSFSVFLMFALSWAVVKFAVAAVPGGAVIVVIPLLEQYLGFTGEMIGLLTAIYLIFDPFGTATNVTGNGGFAIIFSRIYGFVDGVIKRLFNRPATPETIKS